MKIAICFNGQLRTAVHAAPQILKWIGPLKSKCDFFIHTWDINTYKNYPPGLSSRLKFLGINLDWDDNINNGKDIPLNSSELEIISNIYYPKILSVDNFYDLQNYWFSQWYNNYYKRFNLPNSPHEYWNPLYYSFFRSIELKREYEKKEGFEYDIVFKIRPDVSYPLNKGILPTTKSQYRESSLSNEIEKFNLDKTKFYDSGDECTWYGSSKVMNIAADYWYNKLGDELLNMSSYLAKYNIKVDTMFNSTLAFHRFMAKNCPADDWPLIFILENLFNDGIDIKNLESDSIWRTKLYNDFREYRVMDEFSKMYGSSYTLL